MAFGRTTACAAAAVVLGVGGLAATSGAGAAPAPQRLEAESMSLPSSQGQVRSHPSASNGRSLFIWSNGTASASVYVPASGRLTVRARGLMCEGAPLLRMAVDGRGVLTTYVRSSDWRGYRASTSTSRGWHRISVSFVNDRLTPACDRNLDVDSIGFPWVTATATPTSPAAPPTSQPRRRP